MTTYEIVSTRKRATAKILGPADVWELLKKYVKKDREHLFVLTLNGSHAVISVCIVSIGLANRTIVHPREVFKRAITDNATGIIAVHNHPSGNLTPSEEDEEVFGRLKEAGEVLGIGLVDFVIITKSGYFSFVKRETD
jgi:DNA repair protein RadC